MFSDEILSISSIFKHILQIIILKYIFDNVITRLQSLFLCVVFILAWGRLALFSLITGNSAFNLQALDDDVDLQRSFMFLWQACHVVQTRSR